MQIAPFSSSPKGDAQLHCVLTTQFWQIVVSPAGITLAYGLRASLACDAARYTSRPLIFLRNMNQQCNSKINQQCHHHLPPLFVN